MTPAPAPAADSAPSGGQVLHGTGSQGLGTVHVATDSTLTWDRGSCGSGNFIVNNDRNDDSMIDVNALDQTSGKTFIAAGVYHQVEINTEGGARTMTMTPGDRTH
jgi:hypothetical protein